MSVSQSEASMSAGSGVMFLCFFEYHIIHKRYECPGIFIIYKELQRVMERIPKVPKMAVNVSVLVTFIYDSLLYS